MEGEVTLYAEIPLSLFFHSASFSISLASRNKTLQRKILVTFRLHNMPPSFYLYCVYNFMCFCFSTFWIDVIFYFCTFTFCVFINILASLRQTFTEFLLIPFICLFFSIMFNMNKTSELVSTNKIQQL